MIQNKYPKLKLYGEEDTSKTDASLLETKISVDLSECHSDLIIDRLAVFIDPIDGTLELLSGNYANVTSLIGFTYDKKALIGLVHYPFDEKKGNGYSYFNIPNKGIYIRKENENRIEKVELKERNSTVSFVCKSLDSPIKTSIFFNNKVFEKFGHYEIIVKKGVGNKIVNCVLNDYMYISPDDGKAIVIKGLGFWDVCATHALCKEVEGNIFSLDGNELIYDVEKNNGGIIKRFIFAVASKVKCLLKFKLN